MTLESFRWFLQERAYLEQVVRMCADLGKSLLKTCLQQVVCLTYPQLSRIVRDQLLLISRVIFHIQCKQ